MLMEKVMIKVINYCETHYTVVVNKQEHYRKQ